MKDKKSQRKRILIVNVNWLGDTLFSTAAIRAIRKSYPESFIGCMIVPRCKEVLEGNSCLDEIIIYDEDDKYKGIIGKLRFILLLRKKGFDTVFLFQRSFTRLLLCFLAGMPERIGYYRRKSGFLLTKKIEPPMSAIHRAKYFLNLVEEAGIKVEEKNCEFFIPEDAKVSMSNFLKEHGLKKDDFLITINPGGNWDLKRWPQERFAFLADALIEKFKAKIIITGAKCDFKLAKGIKDKMQHEAVIVSGKTTLKELAALLKFSRLIISADTGPMHIAISVGTAVIALFGPTSIEITGPYTDKTAYRVIQKDVGCLIPCYNLACNSNICMQAITIDDILNAVENLNIHNKDNKKI